MPEPDCLAIEHAALAAWPARETEHHDGWVLRASDGVTKRANSATVLGAGEGRKARIAHCEDFYRHRGLPCIVRLPSFVADVAGLDGMLTDRGYRLLDLSLVLYRRLDQLPAVPTDPDLALRISGRDAWLEQFAGLGGLDAASRTGQASILARIASPTLHAVLAHRGEVVSAGLGVVHGEWFGIFDVVTRADRRGRGFGSGLIAWMLRWAREAGARAGYLQVVATNSEAIAIYERRGYRRVYDYWYRVHRT